MGRVEQLLSDDLIVSRHQRFILRLESGQTLLVSHNIDVTPRIDTLQVWDEVRFRASMNGTNVGVFCIGPTMSQKTGMQMVG